MAHRLYLTSDQTGNVGLDDLRPKFSDLKADISAVQRMLCNGDAECNTTGRRTIRNTATNEQLDMFCMPSRVIHEEESLFLFRRRMGPIAAGPPAAEAILPPVW